MYISSVKLIDFRCYRRADTSFVHRDTKNDLPAGSLKNVTLLVGVNGSGKTSVLRAVALATLAPVIRESGYRPYYLVRRPKADASPIPKGKVRVDGVLDTRESRKINHYFSIDETPDSISTDMVITCRNDYEILHFDHEPGAKGLIDLLSSAPEFNATGIALVYNHKKREVVATQHLQEALDEFYNDFSPSFFMLGYGANRRVEEPSQASLSSSSKSRGRRFMRVAGLFEEGVTLIPFSSWLPQLGKTKRYEEIVRLLNRTLPAGTKFSGKFHPDKQPLFRHQGVELPFPALSDGYRSYVGLIGDILSHLNDCCPKELKLTDLTGVVMVDDIDLHLHPQWQREVVPRLAKAFPKLQFILTTHSPLVAGTVHAANVRVIGKNLIHQFSERLNGLSVDQILSSPYFGQTPPRSEESEQHLQELLEGPIDEGDAGPALEFLKELAGKGPSTR